MVRHDEDTRKEIGGFIKDNVCVCVCVCVCVYRL